MVQQLLNLYIVTRQDTLHRIFEYMESTKKNRLKAIWLKYLMIFFNISSHILGSHHFAKFEKSPNIFQKWQGNNEILINLSKKKFCMITLRKHWFQVSSQSLIFLSITMQNQYKSIFSIYIHSCFWCNAAEFSKKIKVPIVLTFRK